MTGAEFDLIQVLQLSGVLMVAGLFAGFVAGSLLRVGNKAGVNEPSEKPQGPFQLLTEG